MISTNNTKTNWIYPSLLFFGASILHYRTISMIFFEDAISILVPWVVATICKFFKCSWILNSPWPVVRRAISHSHKKNPTIIVYYFLKRTHTTDIEMIVDTSVMASSMVWLIMHKGNDSSKEAAKLPLQLGATATIIHALRVFIFVLGRFDTILLPKDFDVKPEHRALHHTRWTWNQVYFASIMSILGIIGVIIIWYYRRKEEQGSRTYFINQCNKAA